MNKIHSILNQPEKFLCSGNELTNDILSFARDIYQLGNEIQPCGLPELYTEGFDVHQIWEEVNLSNEMIMEGLENKLNVISKEEPCNEDNIVSDSNEDLETNHGEMSLDESTEIMKENEIESSEVDEIIESENDQVDQNQLNEFDVDEFDNDDGEFGEMNDQNNEEMDLNDEEMDEDMDEYNEENFFDFDKAEKDQEFIEDSDPDFEPDTDPDEDPEEADKIFRKELFGDDEKNEQTNDNEQPLTTSQKKKKKMDEITLEMEKELLQGRGWQLMGEASAKGRPVNSLLEEVIDFEYTSKPVPIITEETTVSLEDMIKKRIQDSLWDDVERKLTAAEVEKLKAPKIRETIELNDTKGEQSLAEVYEKEYLAQKEAAFGDAEKDAIPEHVKKQHDEVKQLWDIVRLNIDALSHWHFTPRTVIPELSIIGSTNVNDAEGGPAAVEIEETIPVHISDAQILAPQEIYENKKRTVLQMKSRDELSTTEKKTLRKEKKAKNSLIKKRKANRKKLLDKLNPVTSCTEKKATVKDQKNAVEELSKQDNVTLIGRDGVSRNGSTKSRKNFGKAPSSDMIDSSKLKL